LSVPNEGYFKNVSRALSLISTYSALGRLTSIVQSCILSKAKSNNAQCRMSTSYSYGV